MPPHFFNEDVWNASHAGDNQRLAYLLNEGMDHPALLPKQLKNVPKDKAVRALVRAPRPSDGATPFFAACAGGYVTVAQALIDAGADERVPRATDGASPFYIACLMGHTPVARFLSERLGLATLVSPSNPSSRTIDNQTPLTAAAARGHDEVLTFLVDGARRSLSSFEEFVRFVSIRTARGHTAIQVLSHESIFKAGSQSLTALTLDLFAFVVGSWRSAVATPSWQLTSSGRLSRLALAWAPPSRIYRSARGRLSRAGGATASCRSRRRRARVDCRRGF